MPFPKAIFDGVIVLCYVSRPFLDSNGPIPSRINTTPGAPSRISAFQVITSPNQSPQVPLGLWIKIGFPTDGTRDAAIKTEQYSRRELGRILNPIRTGLDDEDDAAKTNRRSVAQNGVRSVFPSPIISFGHTLIHDRPARPSEAEGELKKHKL